MTVKTKRDPCINEQLKESGIEIIVQCRATGNVMMPSRRHQPTSTVGVA
jgi:hypothetical protein